MFESLQITVYLQCGVVSNQFIPLDSILFSVAMRERYGTQDVTISGGKQESKADVELPFERRKKLGEWYYACSFAEWPKQIADGSDHWNKKFDSKYIEYLAENKKVIINRGQFRAYHMPVFYRHALSLTWYCVGDKKQIELYLPFITHVGKKYSQGWGRVLRWEIEQINYDWSEEKNGELMRSIPSEMGILYGIRPSYWLRENQVECKLPNLMN